VAGVGVESHEAGKDMVIGPQPSLIHGLHHRVRACKRLCVEIVHTKLVSAPLKRYCSFFVGRTVNVAELAEQLQQRRQRQVVGRHVGLRHGLRHTHRGLVVPRGDQRLQGRVVQRAVKSQAYRTP